MPSYREKECCVCGSLFKPSSPKQKSCLGECSKTLKLCRDREAAILKRISTDKACLVCGKSFSTTDSKRKYCGSEKCEKERIFRNGAKVESRRCGTRSEYKKVYYKVEQPRILEYKKKYYREVLYPDREVKVGQPSFKLDLEKARVAFNSEGYRLLSTEYINTHIKMEVRCPKGHLWEVSLHNFKDCENRCPVCWSDYPNSRPEKELFDFVTSILPKDVGVLRNTREVISPFELDIYCPLQKVAIEYCGLYWHSEVAGKKPKRYHYDKMVACNDKGIRLLTIFEDEYIDKPEVAKSRIRNALASPEERVYARNTEFVVLLPSVCDDFLNKYHLQGKSGCKFRFGLCDREGRLVQVMTFGSLSRTHTATGLEGVLEMKRFASFPGVSIVGGASKLFKSSCKLLKGLGYKYIKSYCDMRWANQLKPVYETLGFKLTHFTKYTPHYIMGQKRIRNQALRKTPEDRLTGKTEWELRREEGYDRLWDCGHLTFLFEIV